MKIAVFLLFASFFVLAKSGRRQDNFFNQYRRPSVCEWCFAPDKCFQGASEEGVSLNYTTCIAQQCDSENPRRSARWSKCVFDAWREWPCNSVCPTWDWTNQHRSSNCRACIRNCQDKERSGDYCSSSRRPKPCQSCENSEQCYSREEILEQFSRFCLNFIYISCEKNYTNSCILEAIQTPCSQCHADYRVIARLNNCVNCLQSCRDEGLCIRWCTANDYPTSLPCGYCSYFCNLQGRREYPGTCDYRNRCSEACNTCNNCIRSCRERYEGNFNYPDRCECVSTKEPRDIEEIGLVNFLRFYLRSSRKGYDAEDAD